MNDDAMNDLAMNDFWTLHDVVESLLPRDISDATAAVLCDFLAGLALAVDSRYCHQVRRYHEAHRPPVDPEHPWRNLNSD